jgi:hypothetical protein
VFLERRRKLVSFFVSFYRADILTHDRRIGPQKEAKQSKHFEHFQTIFKPFSNHFQTIFKPFSNHFQTIFKPFSNNPTF